MYDSFDWMKNFGDPSFEYHRTMATVWGLVALRLADSRGPIHIDHQFQARAVRAYVNQVSSNVSPSALVYLELAAARYQHAANMVAREIESVKWAPVDSELNNRLAFTERFFLHHNGLPKRKWFKNR